MNPDGTPTSGSSTSGRGDVRSDSQKSHKEVDATTYGTPSYPTSSAVGALRREDVRSDSATSQKDVDAAIYSTPNSTYSVGAAAFMTKPQEPLAEVRAKLVEATHGDQEVSVALQVNADAPSTAPSATPTGLMACLPHVMNAQFSTNTTSTANSAQSAQSLTSAGLINILPQTLSESRKVAKVHPQSTGAKPGVVITDLKSTHTIPELHKCETTMPISPRLRMTQIFSGVVRKPLPPGRSYHYFLSHKKNHSKLGNLPEQIARNLHDSLELMGWRGFFDVDDLEHITQEELAGAIEQSCGMIVFLNDESADSEWCRLEWESAKDKGIPLKCVVDMQRFPKEQVKQHIQDKVSNSHLWTFQWCEFTERHRHQCLKELSKFLQEQLDTFEATSTHAAQSSGVLCWSDGNGSYSQNVFHPWLDYVTLVAGVPYALGKHHCMAWAWVYFQSSNRVLCFGVCSFRLFYATGPSFTDTFSCLWMVLLHIVVFSVGEHLRRVMLDVELRQELILQDTTTSILAQRLYVFSKWLAVVIIAVASIATVVCETIYMPLFFDPFYINASGEPGKQAFGIVSGLLFAIFIPPFMCSVFTGISLPTVLLATGMFRLVGALESVSPILQAHGVLEVLKMSTCRIPAQTEGLLHFQEAWVSGMIRWQKMQRRLAPIFVAMIVMSIYGALYPLSFVLFGTPFERGVHWANVVRLLGCYCALTLLGLFTLLGPLYVSWRLQQFMNRSIRLVFTDPTHSLFVSNVFCRCPASYHIYCLPWNYVSYGVYAAVMLLPAISWGWVEFHFVI